MLLGLEKQVNSGVPPYSCSRLTIKSDFIRYDHCILKNKTPVVSVTHIDICNSVCTVEAMLYRFSRRL